MKCASRRRSGTIWAWPSHGEFGHVVALGVGAGPDAVEHRIAGRLQRRARPRRDRLRPRSSRRSLLCVRQRRRCCRRAQEEGLGLGDAAGSRGPRRRPVAVGLERIALALVFAAQVEDQAGEEDPEHVERRPGRRRCTGDGASAWMTSQSLTSPAIRPGRTSVDGCERSVRAVRTSGPIATSVANSSAISMW